MFTFPGGNGLAEVEEGDSGETLACADDAHKADVYTFSMNTVLLIPILAYFMTLCVIWHLS